MEGFAEHLKQTRGSPHTARKYARDAEGFAVFLDGRQVSVALVEEWAVVQNYGARKPQTVRRKFAAVRALLAWRAAHGDMAAKQTLVVLVAGYRVTPSVRQVEVDTVTPATEEDYRRGMDRADPMGRALLTLLWHTGARISELVGDAVAGIPALTVEDGQRLAQEGHVETITGVRQLVGTAPTESLS